MKIVGPLVRVWGGKRSSTKGFEVLLPGCPITALWNIFGNKCGCWLLTVVDFETIAAGFSAERHDAEKNLAPAGCVQDVVASVATPVTVIKSRMSVNKLCVSPSLSLSLSLSLSILSFPVGTFVRRKRAQKFFGKLTFQWTAPMRNSNTKGQKSSSEEIGVTTCNCWDNFWTRPVALQLKL